MAMSVEYGTRQAALVTHISGDNLVYVQLGTSEVYALPELSKSIEDFVKAGGRSFHPELGERCLAASNADGVWYRAIVTSVSGSEVCVYYVDYGNTELLSAQNLRSLSEPLFESPYQSIPCVLSDFLLTSTLASVNAVLLEELLDSEVYIMIQSKCPGHQHKTIPSLPCYNVAVYKSADSACTISESLVEKGLGHFCICSNNVQCGKKYMACTSFHDSPGKFWVQFSDQYDALLDLMDSLNDERTIAALQPFPLSAAVAGVACCSLFDEDNRYYRAEIVTVGISDRKATICFVDYGNVSTVKLSDIKLLPASLAVRPSFAVQCCLDGVKPIKPVRPHPRLGNIAWTMEVCQKFKELTEEVEFETHIVDEISPEIFSVHLLDIDKGTDIGKLLCDLKFTEVAASQVSPLLVSPVAPKCTEAAASQVSPLLVSPVASKCTEAAVSQASPLLVSPVSSKRTTYEYVTLETEKTYRNLLISYAESPCIVWCQPVVESEKFDAMIAGLEDEGPSLSPLDKIEVDKTCCVQYALDQSWCRGSIQDVDLSSHTADILYVDFGNVATLKWLDVKALPIKYLSIPAQAASFSLTGISPRGEDDWSKEANNFFQELVVDRQLDCKTVGLDDDGFPAAILYDPLKKGKDVSLELVDRGYAKLSLTSVASTSQLSSSSHVLSPPQSQEVESPHQSQRSSRNSSQKMSPLCTKDASDVSCRHPSSGSRSSNRSSMGTYSVIELMPGQMLDAMVCHVESPTEFYIQPTTNSSRLGQLTRQAQAHSKSSRAVRVLSLQTGLPVLAQFSADGCWHRAIVMSSSSKETCHVTFVDYGNTEAVGASKVIEMCSEFLDLPRQAIRCTLAGVKTNINSPKNFINAFGQMAMDETFHVDVKSSLETNDGKRVYAVDLTLLKGQSVARALSGKATFSAFFESATASQAVKIPLRTFPVNKPVDVVMSYIHSPSIFFVHLAGDREELEQLSDELNEFYVKDDEVLTGVKVGSFCVAQFSADQLWYRGRVSEVKGSNATVSYIDFGNSEKQKLSALKALKPDFSKFPSFGIPCKLGGVSESESMSEQVLNDFFNVIDQQLEGVFQTSLLSYEDVIPVKLTDISRPGIKKDVFDDLFASKKVSPVVRLAQVAPTLDSPLECVVSFITNPGAIYCQLAMESDCFQSLMDELNAFYGTKRSGTPLLSTTVGSVCAVLYTDDVWYRGKITSISPTGASVYYLDYGNTEDVEMSAVRALEPSFCTIGAQAIKCSLANLQAGSAAGWSSECVEGVNMILEETVEVTFLSTDESKYDVAISHKGADIATMLISEGWAQEMSPKKVPLSKSEMVLTVNPFPVEEGSGHHIIVTYAISPFEVYCQIIDDDENLDILMEEIALHCARATGARNISWEPGDFALGQFTEDKCWYRCVITVANDASVGFEVLYLDYGNSEIIDRSCLLPLPPDFAILPAQAVKCRLEGAQYYKYSAKSIEDFNALLLNREFNMKCVCVSEDSSCAVELYQVEDSADIMLVVVEKDIVRDKISAINSCISSELSTQAFPDKISVDSFHDVQVVFADSPSNFFCQFSFDNIESLQLMMAKLQEFCSSSSSENIDSQSCKIGDFVAAQFSADEQWYRGVVNTTERDQANVFFVDYGNKEEVEVSKLRKLASQFMDLEAQAVPCSLAEVVPAGEVGWSDKAIDAFNTLSLERACIAQIRSIHDMSRKPFKFGDNQRLSVSLIDSEVSKSVADELTRLEYAVSSLTPELAKLQPLTAEAQLLSQTFLHPKLHPGDVHEVYISFIESPSLFWLQFSSNEDSLISIQDKLDSFYSDSPAGCPVLQNPGPGSSCCAKFSDDGKWYRGTVKAVLSTGVEVNFVDYGNTEVVLASDVVAIQPEMLALEVQAFCCSLDDCHPVGDVWDESAIGVFSELVTDKLLHVRIIFGSEGKCWGVKLIESETDICDQLLQSGVTTAESSLSLTEARSAPKISGVELSVAQRYSVYIAFIDSPSNFFCQLASDTDNLESLMAEIADFYNANELEPLVEVGSYCVAQYSSNCAWYRAQIVSVVSDGVFVNFIDYGNSEVVAPHQVLALGSQFATLPRQAMSCSLVENTDTPFSDDIHNNFMEYDLNQEFSITISSVTPSGQYVVQLVDQEGNSVNNSVLNYQLVSPPVSEVQLMAPSVDVAAVAAIEAYLPLQFGPGDCVDAFISHVTSPTSFFCQPLQLAGELDDLMTDIGTYMASIGSVQSLQQDMFRSGTVCLGQFTEDSEWYRAVIEEVISGANALVSFVDYGNREVLSSDHIAVLPPQFGKQPLQAFHCSLFDSAGADMTWNVDQVEQFRSLVPESDQISVKISKLLREKKQHCVSISRDGKSIDISFLLKYQFPAADDLKIVADLEARHVNPQTDGTDISVLAVKGSSRDSGSDNGETESDNESEGKPLIKAPFKLSLAVQEVLEVSVVYIEDPSLIYIQRADCESELLQLSDEIAQYCADLEEGEHFPQKFYDGDFVLAKWSEDDMWYRGEVLGADSTCAENTLQISFIDYGNIEAISSDAIVMCPSNLLELPAQAISCSLAQVPHRDSWPVLYRDTINEMVSEKVLQVTVILPGSQGMKPTVKLEDLDTGKDISQFVLDKLQEECEVGSTEVIAEEEIEQDQVLEVKEEDGCGEPGEEPLVSVRHAGESAGEASQSTQYADGDGTNCLPSLQPVVLLPERNVDDFSKGFTHHVFVISCSSPRSFLCQFSNEADSLADITRQLSEIYAEAGLTTPLQASFLAEGVYVSAQYQEDKQWYRARVTGCTDADKYEVRYIDFGNSESVPLNCIRPLDESLTAHPPMAVEYALGGLEAPPSSASEFSSDAADMLLELVGEEECTIEIVVVSESSPSGVILTSAQGVNIGAALLEAELASASDEPSPGLVSDIESGDSSLSVHEIKRTSVDGKEELVLETPIVLSSGLDEHVPCQDQKVGSPAKSISVDLSRPLFVNVDTAPCKLDCGDMSLSKDQQPRTIGDNQNKAPENQTPTVEVQPPTPEKLSEQQPLTDVSRTSSENVSPTSDSPLSTPDTSATSDIFNHSLDEPLDSSPPPEFAKHLRSVLTGSSCHSVKLTSVSSPNEFTCKLMDQQDQLQDLMNEIASAKYEVGTNDEYSFTHPEPSLPVCCCSSKDDIWHRGEVICAGDVADTFKVMCVDLGVSRSFTLERLKRLKKSFADRLPPQSVKCSLPVLLESDINPVLPSSFEPWELVWPASCVGHLECLVRENGVFQMEVLSLCGESGHIVKLSTGQSDVRELLVARLRDSSKCVLNEVTEPESSDLGSFGAGEAEETLADSEALEDKCSVGSLTPQEILDDEQGNGFPQGDGENDLKSSACGATSGDKGEADVEETVP